MVIKTLTYDMQTVLLYTCGVYKEKISFVYHPLYFIWAFLAASVTTLGGNLKKNYVEHGNFNTMRVRV